MSVQFEKLASLDLKMLRTLLVLLETKNVSQAAERLDLQQSTVSYQLGKLRETLNDPLLLRSGRGLEPSAFAKNIQPGLTAHFSSIESLLFGDDFNPNTATGTLRLACHRNGSLKFLKALLATLKEQLPLVCVEIIDWSEHVPTQIKEGKIDFAVGFEPEQSSQLQSVTLVEVGFQIVMSQDHPMTERELTQAAIFDYPHAVISSNDNVERWLDYLANKQSKSRVIEFASTSMEFTTMSLEDTDRLMFVADTNDAFFDSYKVVTQPAPFIPNQAVKLLFHERAAVDPLKKFMLELIKVTARSVFDERGEDT